jgi:hypothetical protein
MDATLARQITHKVMSDKTKQPISIRCIEMMAIISALTLSRKHPRLHKPMKEEIRRIQKVFSAAILALHPDAKSIIPTRPIINPDMELSKRVFGDELAVPVYLTIAQVWIVVTNLQLAVIHPDLPKSSQIRLTSIAHQFESAIIVLHPNAADLLDAGWDRKQDYIFKD